MKKLILVEKHTNYTRTVLILCVVTIAVLLAWSVLKAILGGGILYYLSVLLGAAVIAIVNYKNSRLEHIFELNENNELTYKDTSKFNKEDFDEYILDSYSVAENGLHLNLISLGSIKQKASKLLKADLLGSKNLTSLRLFIDKVRANELTGLNDVFTCPDSRIRCFADNPDVTFTIRVENSPHKIPAIWVAFLIALVGIYAIDYFTGY